MQKKCIFDQKINEIAIKMDEFWGWGGSVRVVFMVYWTTFYSITRLEQYNSIMLTFQRTSNWIGRGKAKLSKSAIHFCMDKYNPI